jgi:hypothetical protein
MIRAERNGRLDVTLASTPSTHLWGRNDSVHGLPSPFKPLPDTFPHFISYISVL